MTTIPWTETEIAEAKTKCAEALSALTLTTLTRMRPSFGQL
jgi:hypothetical protein